MRAWYTVITILPLLAASCSLTVGGGISDHGNEMIAGVVTLADGTPASGVEVTLLPADYNHITDSTRIAGLTAVTDDQGRYAFDSLDDGDYALEAQSQDGAAAALRGIRSGDGTRKAPELVLDGKGTLYYTFDSTQLSAGMMLFMPGMRYYRKISLRDRILLSDVPPGLVALRAYDPKTARVIDLGNNFMSIEIEPGKVLIFPSRTQTPFCLRADTVVTDEVITVYAGDTVTFAPVLPSEKIDGNIAYRFSWGDGTISEWSSDTRWRKVWSAPGVYFVQSQVMRTGQYSAWSDQLTVEVHEDENRL